MMVSLRLDDCKAGKAGEKRQHGEGVLHGLGSLLLLDVAQAFAWRHHASVASIAGGAARNLCQHDRVSAIGSDNRVQFVRGVSRIRRGGESGVHFSFPSLLC
jgi:hypothetical protein